MDLEKRLTCAQMLNDLLKQEAILSFKKQKPNKEVVDELNLYVKSQLNNLLLKVMGEQSEDNFNNEEVRILKAFITKIKHQSTIGANNEKKQD